MTLHELFSFVIQPLSALIDLAQLHTVITDYALVSKCSTKSSGQVGHSS